MCATRCFVVELVYMEKLMVVCGLAPFPPAGDTCSRGESETAVHVSADVHLLLPERLKLPVSERSVVSDPFPTFTEEKLVEKTQSEITVESLADTEGDPAADTVTWFTCGD